MKLESKQTSISTVTPNGVTDPCVCYGCTGCDGCSFSCTGCLGSQRD